MYEIHLNESSFRAQADGNIRDITVGGLLREVGTRSPNADAVVDIDADGRAGRTWTYAELLTEAETLALVQEWRNGLPVLAVEGLAGATCFAGGAGRHGEFDEA